MKSVESYQKETAKTLGTEVAAEKSLRLRNAYIGDPMVMLELLNRLGLFCILETPEDIVLHNEAIKLMADIGMIGGHATRDAVDYLLKTANTPKIYGGKA